MEWLEVPTVLSVPDWVVATITVLSVTEIHVAHSPLLLWPRPDPWGPGETDQVGVHHAVVTSRPLVVLVSRLLQSGHGYVLHLLLVNLEIENSVLEMARPGETTHPCEPVRRRMSWRRLVVI